MYALHKWWSKKRLSPSRRASFYESIRQFIENGRDLTYALQELDRVFRERHDPLAALTGILMEEALISGTSFEVVVGWLPDQELSILLSGEASGAKHLASAFAEAAALARDVASIQGALMKVYGQIGLNFAILLFLLWGFNTSFVPQMADTLPPSRWPLLSSFAASYSGFIVGYWWAVLITLYALAEWVRRSLPRKKGILRPFLDHLPPWSIYKAISGVALMKAIGGKLRQGVSLQSAVSAFYETASPYVAGYVERMLAIAEEGRPEAEMFDVGLLDRETATMVVAIGRGGNIERTVSYQAEQAVSRVLSKIGVLSNGMLVLGLLLVGLHVAMMAGGFMQTILEATQTKQGF